MNIVLIVLLVMALAAIYYFVWQKRTTTRHKSFRPGAIWRDAQGVHINAHGGGIMFVNHRYYWFGEHKIKGYAGNMAQVGIHCYSSDDLYNWQDEGIAFAVDTENEQSEVAKGCIIERPKVVYNQQTGKYVMWFHLELKGQEYKTARVAVATSNTVAGPYQYWGSHRPNAGIWPMDSDVLQNKKAEESATGEENAITGYFMHRDYAGGQMSRDITVFQDEDGKAYLFSASEENYTMHIHELSGDYTGFTGKWTRIFPGDLNEAPAVFKRAGKYYLISSGCTGWDPNAARAAVAPSIWGPWAALGNPCIGHDADGTFHSQSTYVIPVQGKKDAFIFMADRWKPRNPVNGRYVWLPITFDGDKPILKWHDEWDLELFT